MAAGVSQARSVAEKIFDNIIFLEDIFGDREDEEIPDIPVLELAKSLLTSAAPPETMSEKKSLVSWCQGLIVTSSTLYVPSGRLPKEYTPLPFVVVVLMGEPKRLEPL